jgi:hypothetical protein
MIQAVKEAEQRLEKENFVWLCRQKKTQARIAGILATGKAVRN